MGIGIGVLSVLFLFLIFKFTILWLFIAMVIVWIGILVWANWLAGGKSFLKRIDNLVLNVASVVAFISLLSLVEWQELQYFLIVLAGLVMALSFSWTVRSEVSYMDKPYRRMLMMLWVFNAYALTTAFFAASILFPRFPFWILALLNGILFGLISFMVWRMYFKVRFNNILLWAILVALAMIEIIWVFHFLTFAHLAAGFFVTWIWYLINLFIRFHFDKQDIAWQRQKWFLLFNVIAYIVLLVFFVRWV